jgi:hypothetical protein
MEANMEVTMNLKETVQEQMKRAGVTPSYLLADPLRLFRLVGIERIGDMVRFYDAHDKEVIELVREDTSLLVEESLPAGLLLSLEKVVMIIEADLNLTPCAYENEIV